MATQTATRTGSTTGTTGAGPVKPQRPPFSDRALAWIKAHRQLTSWIGTILVIGAVLFVWQLSTKRRSEDIASRELQSARYAFENQNMRRPREAGEAYENGSTAARLDFLKAQMLSDAGRAWTIAADTSRALAAYRRIVKDFPKEATVTEAKVRMAELTKGTVS